MSEENNHHIQVMSSEITTVMDKDKLTLDEIFKFIDLYFNRKYIMYNHIYNSYNNFIEDSIRVFLKENDNTFYEKITKDSVIKYKFEFDNITLRPPIIEGTEKLMFPSDARNGNYTYASRLEARVSQIQEISDVCTKEVISRKVVGDPEERVPIATIPILVRSKFCSLNLKKNYDVTECDYDPGCYFIINGYEKVVISQERMIDNKPLVFHKKGPGAVSHYVQVNSRSPKLSGIMQIIRIQLNSNGALTMLVPILNEFPIMILFRALGIKSDSDIVDYIVTDKKDQDMLDMVKKAIRLSIDDRGKLIQDQSDAINYLTTKIRVPRKYSETDRDLRQKQKKKHLESLLVNNFLPHITGGNANKVYYLGYMINKLLNCALGRIPPDDRDSYVNKRVDGVGQLLDILFRQFFKKLLNECNKYWKKRNTNDEHPINIINQIRPNTIEQGIKAALSTGAWGAGKKGVAQVLQRLTYLQAIEMYRRIDSPSNDASSSKLTGPRQIHPTQNGFLCCVVGDTEVLLSDGTMKKIKDLTTNELVVTVNNVTLEKEISPICNYFKKGPERILEITTVTGIVLRCTLDHELLVLSNIENKWVRADTLTNNDYVFVIRNSVVSEKISEIKLVEPEYVYDFTTVSNNHSFIANGIVVHNCVETPEHAKVGLVKHLTLIGSVTVPTLSQVNIIKKYLDKRITKLSDVHPTQVATYTRVFLNGDLYGVCDKPILLFIELKTAKYNNGIEATTGIVFDDLKNEIRVNCDGGRLYRPVIRVIDNMPLLTKKHIELISPNKTKSATLISSWDEFMQRFPGVVEYIDAEEQCCSMMAPNVDVVYLMRNQMVNSAELAKTRKEVSVINRYGDMTFLKYSHCEFHPSLLLGLIVTNIPFPNHNQGPRNVFQYAQGKQGMCIYSSNYRFRLDTSYILYHPHKPLINTRTSKYMYNDVLSPGENAVVAIACYTG